MDSGTDWRTNPDDETKAFIAKMNLETAWKQMPDELKDVIRNLKEGNYDANPDQRAKNIDTAESWKQDWKEKTSAMMQKKKRNIDRILTYLRAEPSVPSVEKAEQTEKTEKTEKTEPVKNGPDGIHLESKESEHTKQLYEIKRHIESGSNNPEQKETDLEKLEQMLRHYEPKQQTKIIGPRFRNASKLRDILRSSANPQENLHVTDLLSPKNTDDLLAKWEETDANYAIRDTLLEEMVRKGVRPETWITNRDLAAGLYPDVDDPDFAAKLSRKTEFASLQSEAIDENTCLRSKDSFEKTAVQRLVARFLHPSTPYNGLLLHHGVGVGKTCSAITVAETFLESLPMNTVYVIVPQAIADGFRRTIFDPRRLKPNTAEEFRLTGERWSSVQCTGSTYLHLTGLASSSNLEEITDAVDQEVKRRYKIMGYLAFANFIESKKKEVPTALTGQERIDAENAKLMSLFSDHLIIVDEAHNLRDYEEEGEETDKTKITDASEGKKLTPLIKQVLRVAEGLRLMLMTATPMYNTAPEIVFLLNLLYLNDTKDESLWVKTSEIFREDSSFVDGGEAKLQTLIRRYVSFMRGEHPNTFPLRLTPANAIPEDFEYPTISMKASEELSMNSLDRKILYNLPLIVHSVDDSTQMGKTMIEALRTHKTRDSAESGREVTNLDSFIQLGNLVYPDGTHGQTGFGNYFEEKRIHKLTQYVWKKKTPTIDSVFGSGLKQYSPKMAAIVKSVTDASGISFIFSRYKKAGAIPLAIALEMAGWCRVLANGTLAPLLKRETTVPPTKLYVLLTSDELISPDFKGLLSYATTFQNDAERNGSKVKAILGSQIASEGLDLKCIRELHLLEGWFHLNRIEQIEGRGVRFCSHADLPLANRNCLIYLHALHTPVYETPDLYMYRIAVRKAQPIGRVTRLMKINAWDCMLNRDAILLKDLPKRNIVDAQGRRINGYDLKDKEYSSFCDFSEQCIFECSAKRIEGENTSTYKKEDFRQKLLMVQDLIAKQFLDEEVALPIANIRKMYEFHQIPWSIAEIGLRECLGRMKIKRDDGIIGTLIFLNDYIVFQPDKVTDHRIPLSMRYGRAYGILPREFHQSRPILSLTVTEEPVLTEEKTKKQKVTKQPVANNNGPVNYEDSMRRYAKWKVLLEDILTKPTGAIDRLEMMEHEVFLGWRWVFYRFRSLPEIRAIACQWWLDNFLSWRERLNVLLVWTKENHEDLEFLRPHEVFDSPKLKGFFSCDSNNQLSIYCQSGIQSEPAICPSILKSEVEKLVKPPVDRTKDTGKIFGFASYMKNVLATKTVLKQGPNWKLSGLQCVGLSTLQFYKERMEELHAQFGKYLGDLLLDDSEPDEKEKAARKKYYAERYKTKAIAEDPDLDSKFTKDLALKQLCPYMEIILRYADKKGFDGKRWFLTAAEMARIR
jgi:hypothetical protein